MLVKGGVCVFKLDVVGFVQREDVELGGVAPLDVRKLADWEGIVGRPVGLTVLDEAHVTYRRARTPEHDLVGVARGLCGG